MAEVNKFYRGFEERLFSLINHGSREEKEKLLFYFRLYNHLLNALNLMNTSSNRRSFYFLGIVANLTSQQPFSGEEHYLKYINRIARYIISNKRRILDLVKKDSSSDPLHANTRLITAQNICMMRVLKLSRVV